MSLENNRELAENKLILLYIIDKINIAVSNLQITKLILENKFMNYFFLQQYLNELCDSGFLIKSSTDEKTFYTISQSGKQTLAYFSGRIPVAVKTRIDNTIQQVRNNIRNETLVTADYTPESENEYIVTCKVHEDNFSLMDLKITVGTKNDARLICENWANHSQEIYSEIIESVTKKRQGKAIDN